MILWHLGGGLVLARAMFGRDMNFRLVALGTVLPDLIDKPIGRIALVRRFHSGRIFSHTLLFCVLMALLARYRKGLSEVAAGTWTHLVLDAIWDEREVALWPLEGAFPRRPVVGRWWRGLLPDGAKLAEELVGGLLLIHWFDTRRRDRAAACTQVAR